MHYERRKLGLQYKHAAPPLLQEYIYYTTAKKYGDPLGSSSDDLCQEEKLCGDNSFILKAYC